MNTVQKFHHSGRELELLLHNRRLDLSVLRDTGNEIINESNTLIEQLRVEGCAASIMFLVSKPAEIPGHPKKSQLNIDSADRSMLWTFHADAAHVPVFHRRGGAYINQARNLQGLETANKKDGEVIGYRFDEYGTTPNTIIVPRHYHALIVTSCRPVSQTVSL